MKKILIFTIFLLGFSAFATNENPTNCPTTDKGVVINGIRWATRNVDAPGTFAKSPESPGMFFQWNRRKGWNAVDEEVEGWDNSIPEGTKWYAENDPCPEGWRVPTFDELRILRDVDNVKTTLNGVNGTLFGTTLFLPFAGSRSTAGRLLNTAGRWGWYWSSTQGADTRWAWAGHLFLGNDGSTSVSIFGNPIVAYPVRCVAK